MAFATAGGLYRIVEAVKGISFHVSRGEMVGFIGPNGAGKSTTIKMLTGILVPTSGRVLVNGIEPYRHRQQNAMRVSVVFGQRWKLWWDLPCMESFELHRAMYRIPDSVYERNVKEFTELPGRVLVVEFAQEYSSIEVTGGEVIADEGLKKSIRFSRDERRAIDLISELGQKYEITDVSVVEPEIEAIIREIYMAGAARVRERPRAGR